MIYAYKFKARIAPFRRSRGTIAIITAAQLRASRALLGIDQRKLAELAGLSLPTIQRMEASEGVIRGNVNSLMKLIEALDIAGIELIAEGSASQSRRPRRAAEGLIRRWRSRFFSAAPPSC